MILSGFAGVFASAFRAGPPSAPDDLSIRCASVLAALARADGLMVATSGVDVAFQQGTISTRARIEARQSGPGRVVVSVAVDSAVEGMAAFTVGSVGVGRNEPEAVATAIEEWGAMVAPALLGALVVRERARERYVVDGYVAYPGATGFRGPSPPAWDAAEHQRLLAALRRALPIPIAGRMRALTLTVMVEQGQMPQGEVRFDGVAAPSLWPAVQVFDWPLSRAGYIFKQFYLLAPAE